MVSISHWKEQSIFHVFDAHAKFYYKLQVKSRASSES